MPDTNGVWSTTRFVDSADLRHDMHCNIVTFKPGGVIPFLETHVMEHGLRGAARARLAALLDARRGKTLLDARRGRSTPRRGRPYPVGTSSRARPSTT